MSTRGVHQEISLCFLQKRDVADCIFVRNSKSWKTHNFPNYRQELYVIIQAAGHHEGICIFQIDWPSRIESGSVNRILFVKWMKVPLQIIQLCGSKSGGYLFLSKYLMNKTQRYNFVIFRQMCL